MCTWGFVDFVWGERMNLGFVVVDGWMCGLIWKMVWCFVEAGILVA